MASVNLSYNERCKKLVSAVENISQNEMEEIFKMIHNYGCNYTRNNNGLFVNLTWIPEELLIKLEKYVNFCSRSQTELKKYESICDILNTKLKETAVNCKEDENISLQLNINLQEINTVNDDINTEETVGINEDDIEEKEITNEEIVEKQGSKISSSMKYSLLKKKYAKVCIINTNSIENDLKQEHYIIKN